MIKYKTGILEFGNAIEKVEIERETEFSVWIKGTKYKKITSYICYFDTFQEAKQHFITHYEKEVNKTKSWLETAERRLKIAQSLKQKI